MRYKFAFISSVNPANDFMFYMEMDTEQDAENYIKEVNATLTNSHIELVSKTKIKGKHEVSVN